MLTLEIKNCSTEIQDRVIMTICGQLFLTTHVALTLRTALNRDGVVSLSSNSYSERTLKRLYDMLSPLNLDIHLMNPESEKPKTNSSDQLKETRVVLYNLLREVEALVEDETLDQSIVDSNPTIILARIILEEK